MARVLFCTHISHHKSSNWAQILMGLIHLHSWHTTFSLWANFLEVLCKEKEIMPQVLFCTPISLHETPIRRQILIYSIKLGSVPEMKCVKKCHQNTMYKSGNIVLNALLHPNFTHLGADFNVLNITSFATRGEAYGRISLRYCE